VARAQGGYVATTVGEQHGGGGDHAVQWQRQASSATVTTGERWHKQRGGGGVRRGWSGWVNEMKHTGRREKGKCPVPVPNR
jgi:hypothetical protein